MNAGDGPHSYVQNSSYQRGSLDVAKPIIEEEISKQVDMKHVGDSAFCIADFGCSTGHNSFPAMQIIIEAIKKKQQSPKIPEFCVYFNDVISNDFNTLFSSLPAHNMVAYHAAGVPGDFHRRLLPPSSIHFAYSSWSLHWLSKVPEAVASRDSPAWNEGQILYSGERKEVCDAYLEQFGKDMESFLESRAVEIVGGGLMALLIPGVPPSWNHQTEYSIPSNINFLGSCLVDMAKKGRLSKAKIDSFNIPYYFTTPNQLKAILQRSQTFSIQRMEILNNPGKYTLRSVEARAAYYRAVHEGLFTHYFGSDIIDELFDLYKKKLAASPLFLDPNNDKSIMILVVLKRAVV
ncbi:hypothetical protein C2S53_015866 [Perilla frutescens var. hirtella]|uniref:S-adenosylmethionine-dependent methyltransferase At5g38100 n=1 Tax=Perilla frutescens var. hirtella TaxID=608512 RepID=A0AAD4J5P3_PERFH|nr:hypothetical protein C2S53_015866 [Perilla frutescens var. hirtella]